MRLNNKIKHLIPLIIFIGLTSFTLALYIEEKVSKTEVLPGETINIIYTPSDYVGTIAWMTGRDASDGWTIHETGATVVVDNNFGLLATGKLGGLDLTAPSVPGEYVFTNGEWGAVEILEDGTEIKYTGEWPDIHIIVLCEHKETRSCGSDIGECESGTQVCIEGRWKNCSGNIEPTEEICDKLDNDCDGNVDENLKCNLAEKNKISGAVVEDFQCTDPDKGPNEAESKTTVIGINGKRTDYCLNSNDLLEYRCADDEETIGHLIECDELRNNTCQNGICVEYTPEFKKGKESITTANVIQERTVKDESGFFTPKRTKLIGYGLLGSGFVIILLLILINSKKKE
ncbi:hypothetical protein GF327_01570 [Candidatus Woesearchaeota archaeon]|nr:hypothetical protein [Candidatus Woesearchaeota archaeon]